MNRNLIIGGVIVAIVFMGYSVAEPDFARAYGDCAQYGSASVYDSSTDTCECVSGYVLYEQYGSVSCVTELSYCTSEFGYGATADSGGDCVCSSGYRIGTDYNGDTACVTGSSYCYDLYGLFSNYDSIEDVCGCSSDYVLSENILGSGFECRSCYSIHGLHSTYSAASDTCECDTGYVLDANNKCIETKNTANFWVDEHDISTKEAIIRNVTTAERWLIGYGFECTPASFATYLGGQLVVNLGNDLTVDAWKDTIVLSIHGEECNVISAKVVSDAFSLASAYFNRTLYRPWGTDSIYYYSNGIFYLVPDAGTFAAKRFNWLDVKDIDPSAVPAAGSALILIKEGAIIRSETGIDVYIVKYMGTKGFKRLVLSPSVFESYGHLRWEDVVVVPQATVDSFVTADLVRVVGDPQVYKLIAQGDTGIRQPVSDAALVRLGLDAESIYEINSVDRGSYVTGDSID